MITEQRKTRGIHRRGTRALQPLATDVLSGTLYFVTDEFAIERSNGTTWDTFGVQPLVNHVTYDSSNFGALSGTWGVDLADQSTYSYVIIGKVLTLWFQIGQTNVSAASNIFINIPGGYIAASATQSFIRVSDAGGANVVGLATTISGATRVLFYPTVAGGTWAITSSNNTNVAGQVTIPVQ